MKKNLIPLLAIAFVVAIACTAVFYGLVAGKLGSGVQANSAHTVLLASRDLSRGAVLSAQDLKETAWTDSEPPIGAMASVAQAVGQTAIVGIAANEPITDRVIASARTGGGLGIPSGMRAISIQVSDSSGVLAMLRPGHRVDIQAIYTHSGSNADAQLRTVLQNVQVLKVNPVPEPSPGKPALPVVTLLTTPAEADVIGLADAVARVRIVLRNPLDAERNTPNGIAIASLMNGRSAPALAAPAVSAPRGPVSMATTSKSVALKTEGNACPPPSSSLAPSGLVSAGK